MPASIGGLTVELLARRYPDFAAGLVFLDAANSEGDILDRASGLSWLELEAACLGKVAARVGLLRLVDPFHFRQEASVAAAQSAALLYRAERMAMLCAFARGIPTSLHELKTAPRLLAEVPLMVLIAESHDRLLPPRLGLVGVTLAGDFARAQERFAQRSTRGTWRVVPKSGHLIAVSQPHAVASAVLEMLTMIRRDGSRPAERTTQ